MNKLTAQEQIAFLKKTIGPAWDDVICVCRQLLKDNACSCNCKEFHNEELPNKRSETGTELTIKE
jgi:hypothetical protein